MNQTQLEQDMLAEELNQREKALDAREMEILSRELKEMIIKSTPTPNKRRGKFSKTKLRVKREKPFVFMFRAQFALGSSRIIHVMFWCVFQLLKREPAQISFPLDFRHTITVKHTALKDDINDRKPPGSPAIQRYKAIARKFEFESILHFS